MLGFTHMAGWGRSGVGTAAPTPRPQTQTPRAGSQDEGNCSILPQPPKRPARLAPSAWAVPDLAPALDGGTYHQVARPCRHHPSRDTTYLGTAAWPPWTGASSPPGSCPCPAHAGWAAPSPQSAGGALGRGHTITRATWPDSTEGWPMDTHHLRAQGHCLLPLPPGTTSLP